MRLVAAPLLAAVATAAVIVSLADVGGVGDGVADNTAAFARGVAAVVAGGDGGTLYVPPGAFVTGPVTLASRMTLLLGNGTTVVGRPNITGWPLGPPLPSYGGGPRYASLIGGVGLDGVRVTTNGTGAGAGAIDGGGLPWWIAYEAHALAGERPHVLEFANCTRLEVDGVTLTQSPFWTVHPVYCAGVHIHDVRIVNVGAPNLDGIDPDSCADVLIERVDVATTDDAIAIKAGTGAPGSAPPCTNVTVRDSTLFSLEACVAIGSEAAGGVSGVRVTNVTCTGAGHGALYIKQARAEGTRVVDVVVDGLTLGGRGGSLLTRFLWLSQHFGEGGENVARGGAFLLPVMANVTVRGVALAPGAAVLEAAVVRGAVPLPGGAGGAGVIAGLRLERVHLGAPEAGWTCGNVSGSWADVTPAPCADLAPG